MIRHPARITLEGVRLVRMKRSWQRFDDLDWHHVSFPKGAHEVNDRVINAWIAEQPDLPGFCNITYDFANELNEWVVQAYFTNENVAMLFKLRFG